MSTVTVTALPDDQVRLDGAWDDLYRSVVQMRTDGRLARIVSAPVLLDSGGASVTVALQPALPPGEPEPLLERGAESPSPRSAWALPSWVESRPTARILALTGLVVGFAVAVFGVALAMSLGLAWVEGNFRSLIPYLLIGFLALGVWAKRSGKEITLAEPVTVPEQRTLASEPVPVTEVKRSRLTGRVTKSRVRTAEPVSDPFAERWLATLRDPHTEARYEDRCALGWFFAEASPESCYRGKRRDNHRLMSSLRDKYGKRLIDDVIEMYEHHKSFSNIADHIEKNLRKKGMVR